MSGHKRRRRDVLHPLGVQGGGQAIDGWPAGTEGVEDPNAGNERESSFRKTEGLCCDRRRYLQVRGSNEEDAAVGAPQAIDRAGQKLAARGDEEEGGIHESPTFSQIHSSETVR